MFAIVNTVIDPPDFLQNLDADTELEEDLSVNEMESVVELVMEHGLDMDNVVPESDEHDGEDFCKKIEIFQLFSVFIPNERFYSIICVEHKTTFLSYFSSVIILIDSPPPKA